MTDANITRVAVASALFLGAAACIGALNLHRTQGMSEAVDTADRRLEAIERRVVAVDDTAATIENKLDALPQAVAANVARDD